MMKRSSLLQKVYELRTYDIKPKYFPDYLGLTNEHFHLRVKHSPLLGYWVTEIGGQNQVCHIWEYDSLAQRKSVRDALVKDTEWMTKYVPELRKFVQKQDNVLMLSVAGSEVKPANKPFFALRVSGCHESTSSKGGELVGRWHTVLGGALNQQVELRAADQLDSLISLEAEKGIECGTGKLLYNAPFSAKFCSYWK